MDNTIAQCRLHGLLIFNIDMHFFLDTVSTESKKRNASRSPDVPIVSQIDRAARATTSSAVEDTVEPSGPNKKKALKSQSKSPRRKHVPVDKELLRKQVGFFVSYLGLIRFNSFL